METHGSSALAWVHSLGIEARAWPPLEGPQPHEQGGQLGHPRHPVLHLVAVGSAPPECSELEDWVREPLDRGEVLARADRLRLRARRMGAMRTYVDDDDVLRCGEQLAILSPLDARLMRTLLDRLGEVVPRQELVDALWPDGLPGDPRALDNRVKAVRIRLRGLGLEIHTLRGRGLLLDRVPVLV